MRQRQRRRSRGWPQRPVDVVVTDLQMPGMDGLEFIREIERRRLGVQVLMITAHASVASAVEAMRHGAFDYLEKPFDAIALERSRQPGLRPPAAGHHVEQPTRIRSPTPPTPRG